MHHRAFLSLALILGACDGSVEGDPGDATVETIDGAIDPRLDATVPAIDAGRDGGDPSAVRLADGIELTGLAAFQGVRVELARAGAPIASRNAPVVADRDVLLRLYVTPGAGWAPRVVRGEVVVLEGARIVAVHSAEQTIRAASSDDVPSSAIDVLVPAAEITPTAQIAARLVDVTGVPAPMAAHPARLPRDGSALALGAVSDDGGLDLVIVPLIWQADGSDRTPDTSDAQLEIIRSLLLSLYPIAHLSIRVHEPVPWSGGLTFTGNVNFGNVNSMLLDLRETDGASSREYYYALVRPADTYSAYCGGSCVTGQSYVVDSPEDGDFRVGSGVGFSGESSAWTLAHEVGHIHGRSHAPCDTSGSDGDYPYAGGALGDWGWDARTGAFQDPETVTDFMGYCDPTWISDYTWSAMFERTIAVRALSAPIVLPRTLTRFSFSAERAGFAGTMRVRAPETREHATVVWLDAAARTIGLERAAALPLSHGDEHLVLGEAPALARAARVTLGATTHTVTLPR